MRVLVAMSGGVDSSVAAALLKEEGHEVFGVTLRVWRYEGGCHEGGSCCSPEDVHDARRVADALGIPFYVAQAEQMFQQHVVLPFVKSYLDGRTPLPCVACNQALKFGFLLKRARQLGAKLATGHYARIEVDRTGVLRLRRAMDGSKDQTYFLFTLGQDELKDVLFPVGGLTKAQVRAKAEQYALRTSHKPESMEICFVPDGDYAAFVEKQVGPQPPGAIVTRNGEVLGAHAGIHRYTVGQRRGLNVSTGQRLYVQRIDAPAHKVVVGPAEEGMCTTFTLLRAHWVDGIAPINRPLRVRVRHTHRSALGQLHIAADGSCQVHMETPVWAVTPGQAAVMYDGEQVLGGGWIG